MASWQAEDTSQGIIQHESAQTLLVHGSAQATQQHNADPGSEFGFISELNSRICDMQGKLETQEAQLRRKAQVPASNQLNISKQHDGIQKELEREKARIQKLQADLARTHGLSEKQKGLLRGLQGRLESKDKVMFELMRQADAHKKEKNSLKREIAVLRKRCSTAEDGWERAERRLEDAHKLYRPQAAAHLHNLYMISNKEVDKQLAQRSAKKLELALESEKQYTKQLEKVSCTASQISCDASARAHDMEDKVRDMNTQVGSLSEALHVESARASSTAQQLVACQGQLSVALRDLSTYRLKLVSESAVRRDAEDKCTSLEQEMESTSKKLASALHDLELERIQRTREADALRNTRASLHELRKMLPVSNGRIAVTRKYLDSYQRNMSNSILAEDARKTSGILF